MTFPSHLLDKAAELHAVCRAAGLKIAVAESCTGGLLAGLLTELAGSSDSFDRGFITYSNEAKHDLLGVPRDMLADYGAVSEQVARAMAEGCLNVAGADLSASVTGVAGPGGGSAMKPVGLVHFGAARRGRSPIHEVHRFGELSRAEIRLKAVEVAMDLLSRLARG
ncbi:MAG: nicotinamide-nucleotide amidohydrolase family protein [Micropepsaceae bacterium]